MGLYEEYEGSPRQLSGSDKTPSEQFSNSQERRLKVTQRLDKLLGENDGYQFVQQNGQRIFEPCSSSLLNPPSKGCEIFIGNIPKFMYEDELIPLFQKVGQIYKFRLMLDFNQKNRGYAFATYFFAHQAKLAIETFNGYSLECGAILAVFKSVDNRRLFVGNIPRSKTIPDIWELFDSYVQGLIDVIMYPSWHSQELNRGFAFLEFESHFFASIARRQLHPKNLVVWDHPLYVDWADPVPEVDPLVMAQVTVLYVKNLPISLSNEELFTMFTGITGTGLIKKTHKILTFAFIHCRDRSSAEVVLEHLKVVIWTSLEVVVVLDELSGKKRYIMESTPKYCYMDSNYRKLLYSPLKNSGFVPEKESEVFVSAIPDDATVYELAEFFEQVGELFQVKLMMQSDRVRNRGYGFVTFMNSTLALKALATLKKQQFRKDIRLSIQKSADNCRIFVGGLPTTATKDEILDSLNTHYGVNNVTEVITYPNYADPRQNRGFVFLEFRTHEEAAFFRAKYSGKLTLFNKNLLVDWSVPVLDVDEDALSKVKIIYMRNLKVDLRSEEFASNIYKLIGRRVVEKVYKLKNYAFVHLNSRENAEKLMKILKEIYRGTEVEITWAKPPNKFSDRNYRANALMKRRPQSTNNFVYGDYASTSSTFQDLYNQSQFDFSPAHSSTFNSFQTYSDLSLDQGPHINWISTVDSTQAGYSATQDETERLLLDLGKMMQELLSGSGSCDTWK